MDNGIMSNIALLHVKLSFPDSTETDQKAVAQWLEEKTCGIFARRDAKRRDQMAVLTPTQL